MYSNFMEVLRFIFSPIFYDCLGLFMLRNNLSYNVCGQIIAYSNRENYSKTLGYNDKFLMQHSKTSTCR